MVEGLCLILTGILLTLANRCPTDGKNAATMTPADALAIGITQALAPLPGLSRSGSTISVGMLMGLGKKFAVTFSFIMGIPAVLGAVVLEIPGVIENGFGLPAHILIIGFVTSLLFGLLAIALVNRLVVSDKIPLLCLVHPHRRRGGDGAGAVRALLRASAAADDRGDAGLKKPTDPLLV